VTSNVKILSGPQFATAFNLRPQNIAWFLGAGASASAGIPTGYAMILDFKTRLFCQQNSISRRDVDPTDSLWVDRIDQFFGTRSMLPAPGDPLEYAAAFEAVFPTEKQRRQYIDDAIAKGKPSYAHRALASLMVTKQACCVFTTNFDPLVEDSCAGVNALLDIELRKRPVVAAIDSVDRAERCLTESDWPLVAKLHGDYQSVQLKNTAGELETQDAKMRAVLTGACQRFGMVVVGYSGRDASVMNALEEAFAKPNAYPAGLYWVTRNPEELLPSVKALLERAAQAGVETYIVQSQNFDEFAADIIRDASLPPAILSHVEPPGSARGAVALPMPTTAAGRFPVLRLSAILVQSLPVSARRLTLQTSASVIELRAALRAKGVRAIVASTGKEVAAFGRDAELLDALQPFGAQLAGTIELHPERESWAHGLLYDALAQALSRGRPVFVRLRRTGHTLLIARGPKDESVESAAWRRDKLASMQQAYKAPLLGKVPKLGYSFIEGIQIRLERLEDRWWFGFEPFTFVDVPREARATDESQDDEAGLPSLRVGDQSADWRRERWAMRYNGVWAAILDAWTELLTDAPEGEIRSLGVSDSNGIDAVFVVSKAGAWSRPAHHHPYFDRTR
jgi:hypothetical protein